MNPRQDVATEFWAIILASYELDEYERLIRMATLMDGED